MSCTVQGLTIIYQMKNLIKKTAHQNPSSFAHFATVRMNKQQLKMVKGGDTSATEVIIVEDVIVG